jgi:hypothetical protein
MRCQRSSYVSLVSLYQPFTCVGIVTMPLRYYPRPAHPRLFPTSADIDSLKDKLKLFGQLYSTIPANKNTDVSLLELQHLEALKSTSYANAYPLSSPNKRSGMTRDGIPVSGGESDEVYYQLFESYLNLLDDHYNKIRRKDTLFLFQDDIIRESIQTFTIEYRYSRTGEVLRLIKGVLPPTSDNKINLSDLKLANSTLTRLGTILKLLSAFSPKSEAESSIQKIMNNPKVGSNLKQLRRDVSITMQAIIEELLHMKTEKGTYAYPYSMSKILHYLPTAKLAESYEIMMSFYKLLVNSLTILRDVYQPSDIRRIVRCMFLSGVKSHEVIQRVISLLTQEYRDQGRLQLEVMHDLVKLKISDKILQPLKDILASKVIQEQHHDTKPQLVKSSPVDQERMYHNLFYLTAAGQIDVSHLISAMKFFNVNIHTNERYERLILAMEQAIVKAGLDDVEDKIVIKLLGYNVEYGRSNPGRLILLLL